MRLVTNIDRGDNAILARPRRRTLTAQRQPVRRPTNEAKPRRHLAERLDQEAGDGFMSP